MSTRVADSPLPRARRPRQAPGEDRPAWGKWVLGGLIAVVLSGVAGYAFAVLVLFPAPPEDRATAEVPGLVGRTRAEAEHELDILGLAVGDVVEMAHPRLEAGLVIAQTPLEGQRLRPGAAVDFAVSTGRPRALVPEVAGFTVKRATDLLGRIGFQVQVSEEPSSAPAGQVVRVSPAAGTRHELPTRVTLVVSQGPVVEAPPPLDTVPPRQ